MKKTLVIIISLFMLNCLFAGNQTVKKDAPIIANNEFKEVKEVMSVHSVIESTAATNYSYPNQGTINHPYVQSIFPNRAWWNDTITLNALTGREFSTVITENVAHLCPGTAIRSEEGTSSSVTAIIPEGTRSCYPTVSSAGISGETYAGPPTQGIGAFLQIVAPLDFPYIRSIVEDRINHYLYVGYDDNSKPKIAQVDLYKSAPTYAIVAGYPDSVIKPYLSRMVTEGTYQGEICYIKENDEHLNEIWCLKNNVNAYWVANIYNEGYEDPLFPVAF